MRLALYRRSQLLAVAVLVSSTLAPALPSYAEGPVGGPQLGSKGIVFSRTPGLPPPPAVTAEGWLVADLDTGAVLGARNPHGKFLPASTIKTLTTLVLLPRLTATQVVKPSARAANMQGSSVGIKAGYPISIDLLFTGMLTMSGNDTATALAEAAGGEALTVGLMNEEAKRLQAGDTVAVNPTGLEADGQSSSAYDLALIGRAALKLAPYRRYTAIKTAQIPRPGGQFQIANKNRLLYTYPGTFGGKTGGTPKAHQTYIGYAERGGHRLVVTILKSDAWRAEAPALLDWGFAADGVRTPVGQLVPSLDEIAASASAAAPTAGSTTSSAAANPSSVTAASASAAGQPPTGKAGKHRSLADRLPKLRLHLRWWYAAGPVALAGLVAIGLAWRRRRRRRRGFYMPETKLRLPVR